jgi:hypothetical protein
MVTAPAGFAFDIADLLLLRAWSDCHGLGMAIELDACDGHVEYEETVTLTERRCPFRRWILWRGSDGIAVQPAMGRMMLFGDMADALKVLRGT